MNKIIRSLLNSYESNCHMRFRNALDREIKELIMNGNGNFKVFKNKSEIFAWANDNYSTWAESLSDEIKNSFEMYCGFPHRDINLFLRDINSFFIVSRGLHYQLEQTEEYILNMEKGLKFVVASENITAVRWISSKAFENLYHNNFIDKGFVSTSLNMYFALNELSDGIADEVLLIINIKKGTSGAFVDSISKREFEAEFLINKNSEIKIDKIIFSKYRYKIVKCAIRN